MNGDSSTNSVFVNVGLSLQATVSCGTAAETTVLVYGDEDDQTPTAKNVLHSPDAKDLAVGTLRLRAERIENGDGRVYLILVRVQDNAGQSGVGVATVVVPKNQSQSWVNAVASQAAAASAYATSHQTPPPGYLVIGDGPVIGPKQ